ncbi:MAG TPA: hypothetical protein DCR58_00385 [Idiomarina baltica]|uniref:Uncharacterized protein n=1 Tax=Idiomarina baltica TaxID=190892 RepID=A0A348WL06_9GAMM|nr:hypothetical protein [Idiomarinaceae bacterium]HAR55218.1 hypothetical protein [Idiomarina baltica]|tara:strand:+ start:3231 stop:3995 length:765 start_codon:yes stop_codon:yes gene_type:complete
MKSTLGFYLALCLTLVPAPASFILASWYFESNQRETRHETQILWQQTEKSKLTFTAHQQSVERRPIARWLTLALAAAQRYSLTQQIPIASDVKLRIKLRGQSKQLIEWWADVSTSWPSQDKHPFVLDSLIMTRHTDDKNELILSFVENGLPMLALSIAPRGQKPCDLSPPGKLLGDWHDYQLLATLATEGNFSAYFQGSDKQWLTAKVGDYFSSPTTMITAISRESVTFKQLESFPCVVTTLQNKVKHTNAIAF